MMDGKILELNDAITAMNQRDKRGYVGPEYQHLHGLVHEVFAANTELRVEVARLTAVEVKAEIYEEALQVIANSHPFRTICIDLAETALSEAAEAVRS